MDRKAHWERVHGTRPASGQSWHQAFPGIALEWIEGSGFGRDARIIDVGGGASTLVDHLLERGYGRVSVLDLSGTALALSQARLGVAASRVDWIEGDATRASLGEGRFDVWHDRAAFHFLVEESDREAYAASARRALSPGGLLIVGAFATDGPARCSGLEVARYDPETLAEAFGEGFAAKASRFEEHRTPTGALQRFVFLALERRSDAGDGG